jgi:glycosyltransferase involved in cell wall biosynthesis
MINIQNISCVIIAKNAEDTIDDTLKSLQPFKEVILYNNNSTDNTKKIAQNYPNVRLIEGDFIGFGPTKNKASSFATNNWIFSLDSDEIIPLELIKELQTLQLKNEKELFIIKRDNYFLKKHIKHSGWGKDFLARLYNKEYHSFNNNVVHEHIAITTETIKTRLKNSFKHNAVTNINQFLQKVMNYSDLASKNKKSCSMTVVILKSLFAFFKTYFLQLGFLDGWRGLVIAISNFNGKFFRYIKRYINCKHL